MQRFALLILSSLIGITCLPFVLSLSNNLEPPLESTLFNDLGLEDTTPAYHDFMLDSTGLSDEDFLNPTSASDLDWLSENVDSNDRDINTLFSDISYSDEPDLGLLFAQTDNACDVGTADDMQFFGKKRRDTSVCPAPFQGEVESSNGSDHDEGSNESGESNQVEIPQAFAPLSIFPEDFDLCPPEIFEDSNIPVCSIVARGTYIPIPGAGYVTLLDVKTRRFY